MTGIRKINLSKVLNNLNSILNIALLAHVDAGKTSITEQLLYKTGEIKIAGSVDKGETVSDVLDVEKSRGISVLSSQMKFRYKSRKINIIDTPGHADFISEVERSLLAVDLVLLIISAYEGVQSQTRNIWKILKKNKIPTLIVVNKIDKNDFDVNYFIHSISEDLNEKICLIQQFENNNINSSLSIHGFEAFSDLTEYLVEFDDELMNQFLNEESIDQQALYSFYQKLWSEAQLYPLIFTSAKTGTGIEALLEEIYQFPTFFNRVDFSAQVYRITHDQQWGKLTHLKILGGSLTKKQMVFIPAIGREEKVNLIKQIFSHKMEDLSVANAGDIVAVTGLQSAQIRDVIGKETNQIIQDFQSVPVLNVKVKAKDQQHYIPLSEALTKLNIEDPSLDFQWHRAEEEFLVKVNGKIQIEILQQLIPERFGIAVEFDEPEVIYKETPLKSAIGFDAYTMPKPCWAVVKFLIEPGERGSGVHYESKISVNDVLQKYQNEIERSIPKALKQGIKGWEVTDLKITLIEGEDHVMHSRPGDFILATPMAIMKGLQEAGSQLLEPILKYRIEAPEASLGAITSEILNLRGEFEQPQFQGDTFILEAKIPVATSMDFPVFLAQQSGGQAIISSSFDTYKEVADEFAKTRAFKGVSPLDRSKYILQERGAIQRL